MRRRLTSLWLRRLSIPLVTAVATTVALTVSFHKQPVYVSHAQVHVKPVTLRVGGWSPFPALVPAVERHRVVSEPVGAAAALDLNFPGDPRALLSHVRVQIAPGSDELVISYRARSRFVARHAAQAFAGAYLRVRKERVRATIADLRAEIGARVDEVWSQLLRARSSGVTRRARRAAAHPLLRQIAILERRAGALRALRHVDVGEITQAAVLPTTPTSPNHAADGLTGLVLGFAVGAFIAILRNRDDRRRRHLAAARRRRAGGLGVRMPAAQGGSPAA
jgi:hypothetical protein